MKPSVRKSLGIIFTQTYSVFVLQFIASMIVARLLTPAEIGVFSVSVVFISIAQSLRDFGVVDYIVQEKELTTERIRSAITVTFTAAWVMAATIFLLSGWIAEFYKIPDVAWVMRILSINFFLLPFSTVVMANMRRSMQFARIAKIRFGVLLLQSSLAVLLAYLGFSYFSMAWAAVAGSLTNIAILQFFRPAGFPILPGLGDLRRVLGFGSFASAIQVLRDLEKGAPDLIIGRLIDMAAVGYFSRATGLIGIFSKFIVDAAGYVALPHFSARLRSGQDLVEPFLDSVMYFTVVGWPFYAFLAFAAGPMVLVLFGSQWGAAVPVLQLICMGEMMLVPFYLQPQLFMSSGLVRKEAMRFVVIIAVKLVPLVVLAPYGVNVVAAGYAAAHIVAFILSFLLLRKYIGIRLQQLWHAVRGSLGVLVTVSLVMALVTQGMPDTFVENLFGLLLSLVGLCVGWILGLVIFRHPMLNEIRRAGGWLLGIVRRQPR